MKKLIAPLVAIALGFASISAFSADTPAKEGTSVTKVKKSQRTAKKHRTSSKAHQHHQAAPAAAK